MSLEVQNGVSAEENKPVVLDAIQTTISIVQLADNLDDEARENELAQFSLLCLCIQMPKQTLSKLSGMDPARRNK